MKSYTTWMQYQEEMKEMESISIPRHVICEEPRTIELHGFCDASEAAYSACLFIQSLNRSGEAVARLLCARSKIAPLKRVTLPRLELCGALLLIKLGETVRLSIKFDCIQYWSDSTITLAWINHQLTKLQTFVANRVATIQRTARCSMVACRSKDNPADVISRGVTPWNLKNSSLWWKGPSWLTKDRQTWPTEPAIEPSEIAELKKQTVAYHSVILIYFQDFRFFIDSRGSQRIACDSILMRSRGKSDKSGLYQWKSWIQPYYHSPESHNWMNSLPRLKISNPNREYRVNVKSFLRRNETVTRKR